jgi:hypothetical protein
MARFMYLFRSNPGMYRTMSPEQMQQLTQKWMQWRTTLEESGHLHSFGERLSGDGKVVRGTAKSVTDGPFVEVKDAIQGYSVIEAKDLEEAAEIAKNCPVLDSDGSVEIRPYYQMA